MAVRASFRTKKKRFNGETMRTCMLLLILVMLAVRIFSTWPEIPSHPKGRLV
jgi:hypothetical protein